MEIFSPACDAAEVSTLRAKEPEEHVWLIYAGQTYQIPMSYVRRHPRGTTLLLPYANQDMTQAFDSAGHSKGAMRTLRKFSNNTVTVAELQRLHAEQCDVRRQVVWDWCVRAGSLLSVAAVLGTVYVRYRQQTASAS